MIGKPIHHERVAMIRAAFIANIFSGIRDIADHTGLGETQITSALRHAEGCTLKQFQKRVFADALKSGELEAVA